MKYFIVGLHGSGKQEVCDILKDMGVKCGKNFSNLDMVSEYIYNCNNYESYSDKDISDIFENNAYVFIQELQFDHNVSSIKKYFEGLSKHTLENNDVFILSPDQLLSVIPGSINEEVCFIWLDNTKSNRWGRHYEEKRGYSFYNRDHYERKDIGAFVKLLYNFENSKLLYFNNEEPSRIATIIYTLIQHPELEDLYSSHFNN